MRQLKTWENDESRKKRWEKSFIEPFPSPPFSSDYLRVSSLGSCHFPCQPLLFVLPTIFSRPSLFCPPFASMSLWLNWKIYRVFFLTFPPNFQYQNEKRWAANRRFCSMKFSMYKRSSLVEQYFSFQHWNLGETVKKTTLYKISNRLLYGVARTA